jgi:quinol monooxygenase YgiN
VAIFHTAHLTCRADHVDAFRARLTRHARITREREPGCLRFNVHQNATDPGLFFLYEVYADDAALKAHQNSEHFHAFRADTADWVTERKWWFWVRDDAGREGQE